MAKSRHVCFRCGASVKRSATACAKCNGSVIGLIGTGFEPQDCMSLSGETISMDAWDTLDHRRVFMRVLLSTAGASSQQALANEARLLASLSGETGFPSFITAGRVYQTCSKYTVFEFVHGDPLSTAIWKCCVTRRIELFMSSLRVIATLHDRGYVHCGISLDRILVRDGGGMCLTSFREAREAGGDAMGTGVPEYRAPEQTKLGGRATPATDVFALGVCLYLLLTQRLPYGFSGEHVSKPGFTPKPPSSISRDVPPDVDEIVAQALQRRPEDRFVSAREFHDAFAVNYGTATDVDDLDMPFFSPAHVIWNGIKRIGCVFFMRNRRGSESLE